MSKQKESLMIPLPLPRSRRLAAKSMLLYGFLAMSISTGKRIPDIEQIGREVLSITPRQTRRLLAQLRAVGLVTPERGKEYHLPWLNREHQWARQLRSAKANGAAATDGPAMPQRRTDSCYKKTNRINTLPPTIS